MKRLLQITLITFAIVMTCFAGDEKHSAPFTIRDEQTAIGFAQVVIRSEFGNSELRAVKRYEVRREGDDWIVKGFRSRKLPKTTHGGVAVVRLKSTGCVVSVRYDI